MLGLIDPAPHSKIGQNTFLQWKVKRLRCTGRKYGQKIVRNHLKKMVGDCTFQQSGIFFWEGKYRLNNRRRK